MLFVEQTLCLGLAKVAASGEQIEGDTGRECRDLPECNGALLGPCNHHGKRHASPDLVFRRAYPRRAGEIRACTVRRAGARLRAEHLDEASHGLIVTSPVVERTGVYRRNGTWWRTKISRTRAGRRRGILVPLT